MESAGKNTLEEKSSDVMREQSEEMSANTLLSPAYNTVAAKVFNHLDIESFLACRMVCQAWRASVNTYSPVWKRIRKATLPMPASLGLMNLCEILLEKGRDVNYVHPILEKTALQSASRNGHLRIVNLLIANNADINMNTSEDGLFCNTALNLAAGQGHVEIVRVLHSNGADVNVGSVTYAAFKCRNEMMKTLLSLGADINGVIASTGKTSLLSAVAVGRMNSVKLLLENGAAAEQGNPKPLCIATVGGYLDIVEVLLDAGADVNTTTPTGLTVLHVAASEGYTAIVEALCDRGADRHKKTANGVTALQMASANQHFDIVAFLQNE